MLVADSLVVVRAAGPYYTEPSCGFDCIIWSGSHDVVITRVGADLEVKALNPATGQPVSQVFWGTDVRFEMKATPWSVDGIQVPLYAKGWTWTGDPSTIPEKTTITGIYGCSALATACAPRIYETGMMEGAAYVNGKGIRKTVRVTVRRRRLLLNVTPSTVVKRGTVLTFNGTRDDGSGGSYTAPAWMISDPAAVTSSGCSGAVWTCSETAQKNYVRSISSKIDDSLQTASRQIVVYTTFRIEASRSTANVGDTVTFTAFLDDSVRAIPRWQWKGVDVPSCANSSECRQVMDTVGTFTMTGWTAPSGGESASVSTSVNRPRLTLLAAPGSAREGEVVTFTFGVDGGAAPASSWRFVPDSMPGESSTCPSGTSQCKKIMRGSGTMWASYSLQKIRDSVSAHVAVLGSCPPTTMMALVGDSIVGTPCGRPGSGGGSPARPKYTLTVHWSPGVQGDPLPHDTIGSFAFDSGTVVAYSYTASAGYRDAVVVVDDSMGVAAGAITMQQNHEVFAEALPDYSQRVKAREYGARLAAMLTASNAVTSYKDFLAFLGSEVTTRGGEAVLADLAAGELEDVTLPHLSASSAHDWVLRVAAADSSRSTRWYTMSSQGGTYAVSDVPAGGGIMAARRQAQVASASTVPRPTAIGYINGIKTTGSDYAVTILNIANTIVTVLPFATPLVVEEHYLPTADSVWTRLLGDTRLVCADQVGRLPSGQTYQTWAYSRCVNDGTPNHAAWSLWNNDYIQAAEQVARIQFGAPVQDSLAAKGVAAHITDLRSRGMDQIWLAHSRGNAMLADGLRLLKDPQSGKVAQSAGCIAALAIAAPINDADFPLDPTLVLSVMSPRDVIPLVVPGLQAKAQTLMTVLNDSAETAITKAAAARRPIVAFQWGKKVHRINENYLVNSVARAHMPGYVTTLHDACVTIAP